MFRNRNGMLFQIISLCLFASILSSCSKEIIEEPIVEEVFEVVELEKGNDYYLNNAWNGYEGYANLSYFSSTVLFPDGLLAFQDATGLWGYLNIDGEIVIEPKFELAYQFDELTHRASVVLNGKYGFIDNSGEFVIEPIYYRTYDFESGYAAVQTDSLLWGYIDKDGNYLHEPEFEVAYDFGEVSIEPYAYASVSLNGTKGFLDINNQLYFYPNELQTIYGMQQNGYFWASNDNGYLGLFNVDGTRILDFDSRIYTGGTFDGNRNLALIATQDDSGNKLYGFINKDGEYLIRTQYSYVEEFVDGYALVMNSKRDYSEPFVFSFINENGEEVVSQLTGINMNEYSQPYVSSEGMYAYITEQGTWGYFDYSGNLMFDTNITPRFLEGYPGPATKDVGNFSNGAAWFVKEVATEYKDSEGVDRADWNDLIGYLNNTGELIQNFKVLVIMQWLQAAFQKMDMH